MDKRGSITQKDLGKGRSMNGKFFDLPKEKQDRFINAALKLFAENGYKRASTDDIVKEAGISKGLLFHYFGSKQGLYEFVYEYSVKYIKMEYEHGITSPTTDFFELQRQILLAQRDLMKSYPYMNVFVSRAFRETEQSIMDAVSSSMDEYSAFLSGIYQKAELKYFKKDVNPSQVLKMCIFISDGILAEQFRDEKIDADKFFSENEAYLHLLKQNFYELV